MPITGMSIKKNCDVSISTRYYHGILMPIPLVYYTCEASDYREEVSPNQGFKIKLTPTQTPFLLNHHIWIEI